MKATKVLCNIKSLHAQILKGLGYLQMAYAFHWLPMSASLLCFSTDPTKEIWPEWVSGRPSWLPTQKSPTLFLLPSRTLILFTLLTAKCLKLDCTPLRSKGGVSPDRSKPTIVIPLPLQWLVGAWTCNMIPTSGHDGKSSGGSGKCTPCSYKVNAFENVDVLMLGAAAAISELKGKNIRAKATHWDFESLDVFDPWNWL